MKYVLTQEQVDSYHVDEIRAEIRSKVSSQFTASDNVDVVGPDGLVWDILTGSLPDDGAVPLTTEELNSKHEKEASDAAHVEYLEAEIRPRVMSKLRSEARLEIREQLREKTDEILKLRADMVRLTQSHQSEIAQLNSKLARAAKEARASKEDVK
jgi:hypothetical protein